MRPDRQRHRGFAVLTVIRAATPNAVTPGIVVSVVSEREWIDRCLAAGTSAYHVKRGRRAELVATLKAQRAALPKPQPLAR
jgi:DNA-binding NarL/FixJ family response regulator